MSLISILVVCVLFCQAYAREECQGQMHNGDTVVCVCNEQKCDNLDPIAITGKDVITVYTTSKDGDRFKQTPLKWGQTAGRTLAKAQTLTIDRNTKYQTIVGFGGAVSDSAAINYKSLPEKLQQLFVRDYYSSAGLEYSMGRVPIAGSDFSTRGYSYNDDHKDDFEMKNFALQKEDNDYKIPLMLEAQKASPHHTIKWFGSTWAPPVWMKNNSKISNRDTFAGYLYGEPGGKYYKAFATYIIKFFEAYKAKGTPIWGTTIENEPENGQQKGWGLNCLAMTAEQQRDFIKMDLAPALQQAGLYNTTHVMFFDENRGTDHNTHPVTLDMWAEIVYKDKEAAKHVSGSAFHWYMNNEQNVDSLERTHQMAPEKFILSTEACQGYQGKNKLGIWNYAVAYARDIMMDLAHWTAGWVDWNLALSVEGGPTYLNNINNAPLIVDSAKKEYYKQPEFYAIGHFSKFLVPDSHRIGLRTDKAVAKLLTLAFVRPDGGTVVIAMNENNEEVLLTIGDGGRHVSHILKANSINNFVFY